MNLAVNEAVEQAYKDGILTCASLMMKGAATQDAVERARRLKGLGVGLHITLADGRPVSPSRLVRGLIDHEGRFRNDLVGSGVRWFFNPLIRLQLAREINAQFQAFTATGLDPGSRQRSQAPAFPSDRGRDDHQHRPALRDARHPRPG